MTTAELVELLRHSFDGDPWHGPSLASVLRRCTAKRAAERVLLERHSIWEIALHLTAWTREVERRIAGGAPQQPAEGDWPSVGQTSPDAWQQALAALEHAHRSLVDAVSAQPDAKWAMPVGEARDAADGTGVSYGVMVVGLATHHAYHAGQIALLG
jgi:hypothetical protein